MKVAAVIPARAGSKGVLWKNTRRLLGVPLWEWSFKAAMASKHVQDCIVTTDCESILDTPLPVTLVERPPELATSEATLDDAIIHAVKEVGFEGLVVVLQPTVPVRRLDLIDDCVETWEGWPSGSVVTVNVLHCCWRRDGTSGLGKQVNPRLDRQKMAMKDRVYHEDGAVFVVHTDELFANNARVVEPVCLYVNQRTVDIDTEEDLKLAEHLLKEGGAPPEIVFSKGW